ncbi:MAG: YkgJ family cysteine cluster protein, partial [Methanoculleus chikugoensis]|nr:YkgJ family cysteine cluster protein [Methanoculleus chikugoensis]
DDLAVSECPGLGAPLSPCDARDVAADLCRRQAAETVEEAGIRAVFHEAAVPPGKRAVIDSEGVKVLHD